MQLSSLEETAWLTLYCQSVAGSRFNLDKSFADWFVGQTGRPSFADRLAWRTLAGVALRAQLIDTWVYTELERARAGGQRLDYWSMGCGFDYRWEKFSRYLDTVIEHYVEFDQPALMQEKQQLLARSPFANAYARVQRRPGNLLDGLPDALPASSRPTLVVMEGVIDYLDRDQKLALLTAIRQRRPQSTLIIDVQNAWAVSMQNRKRQAATGSAQVGFAWAAKDTRDFYQREAGYRIREESSIMRETLAAKLGLLRYAPLPRKIADCVLLLKLQPA